MGRTGRAERVGGPMQGRYVEAARRAMPAGSRMEGGRRFVATI
jgi:hypothetical protein